MTAGLFLVACIGVPAVAALLIAGAGSESRRGQIISSAAGVLALAVAVVAAACLFSSQSSALQARIAVPGWKLTPDEPAPTVTLHLTRPWALAPVLAAACALVLSSNGNQSSWCVHLQLAAVQGSFFAATHEFGLAMVSASTIGAAMILSGPPENAGKRGLATALRWSLADVVLWLWAAGFFGVGTAISRIAAVALLVRASAFPFQGALARTVKETRDVGLLVVSFPAVLWAMRWMEPDVFPNTLTGQLLTTAAVLVPSGLAWASRNDDAAKAYCLTSAMLWPMAFSMPTSTAIALVGVGVAAVLCRRDSVWRLIAGSASVIVPTLSILASARSRELASADLVGWTAVSLSAVLIHTGPDKPTIAAEDKGGVDWREVVLVILALSAFIAPTLSVVSATTDP